MNSETLKWVIFALLCIFISPRLYRHQRHYAFWLALSVGDSLFFCLWWQCNATKCEIFGTLIFKHSLRLKKFCWANFSETVGEVEQIYQKDVVTIREAWWQQLLRLFVCRVRVLCGTICTQVALVICWHDTPLVLCCQAPSGVSQLDALKHRFSLFIARPVSGLRCF